MSEIKFHCPVCRKDVKRQESTFPFCSDRCRIIDLGRWADGSYAVAGESVSIDLADDAADSDMSPY
ncbi:MAG: DNA gyrase inhibitor YacG [Zetaproteobacteria bacterium CG_4_9_14_3_um_filter_49_83]|nr:MAG: DNA gyrase inhibitor YacG [Zetaproteobacteria bacterium CG1_02_49_23]PIQ30025.1 MAG: DNA gyrase inhibitor YacG [Zetaproteobacteria bacterium CG17_big_fil_post_rev_8_21_14_2_50_50_13]PIV30644.1 MAG: DNA gyrase inhibitor YacG [Zetaproteobacteria bacterium CG02_land_8_20_14_3_00_50_9]PIY56027.1 MAG: DNA gyrase inhibitor YacG [Zetaproteobacteria bacterium CG_4_10_14_0_8_um_filter_49_80]PJA36296.1 MAG: DNA gyrase inhibitor YacG [Zetaproteobacteria bacterium CG_4_9_14_3_um_filter_49_83]